MVTALLATLSVWLLLSVVLTSGTEVSRHRHHRHRHHHGHEEQDGGHLAPSSFDFAESQDEAHARAAFTIGAASHAHSGADICLRVVVSNARITWGWPCTQTFSQLLNNDERLILTGGVESIEGCAMDGCPGGFCDWYGVKRVDGWVNGYVNKAFVTVTPCANGGGSGGGNGGGTTPTGPSNKVTGSGMKPSLPEDSAPILPPQDNGVTCYWTNPYINQPNDNTPFRTEPCAGSLIQDLPKDVSLTPLYDLVKVETCTLRSYHSELPAQKEANEKLKAKGQKTRGLVRPFTRHWWTRVRYNGQDGWVPASMTIKKFCDATRVATCPFTALTTKRCFRVEKALDLLPDPCVGEPVIRIASQSILVAEGTDAAAPVEGCSVSKKFKKDAEKLWHHVSFDALDGNPLRTGYVIGKNVEEFPCNGNGWMDKVGPFAVVREDKTFYKMKNKSGKEEYLLQTGKQDAPNKFLLHTIEGAWPNNGDEGCCNSRQVWPHFVVGRNNTGSIQVTQYFPLYSFSRALANEPKSPHRSGNKVGVIQVEIGGRSDNPFTEHDKKLSFAVKNLFQTVARYTGIPICKDARVNFIENSYGDQVQRFDAATFADVHGLVGHQHCYENSHWDPGQIDPEKLLSAMEPNEGNI